MEKKKANTNTESKIKKENPSSMSDSFNVSRIDLDPSISEDILLDTTHVVIDKKKNSGITIVLPSQLKSKYPAVYGPIARFMNAQQKIMREETAEMTKPENGDAMSGYMEIHPLSLYQTDNLISYAFECYYQTSGRMRNFFSYFVINYDLQKKRQIGFNECFTLQSSHDTAFWKTIINGSISCSDCMNSFGRNIPIVKFSFDKDNAYFFFDMFETPFAPTGIKGSANKKYLVEHIKQGYK